MKIGDRVRNTRIEAYKDEPIVVIDRTPEKNFKTKYHIKYLNIYTRQETNMVYWIDEDDITLDVEYYRNIKLEKLLTGV